MSRLDFFTAVALLELKNKGRDERPFFNYSDFKLLTGFATAAFTA